MDKQMFEPGDMVFIVSCGVPQKHLIGQVEDYISKDEIIVDFRGKLYRFTEHTIIKMTKGELLLHKLESELPHERQ